MRPPRPLFWRIAPCLAAWVVGCEATTPSAPLTGQTQAPLAAEVEHDLELKRASAPAASFEVKLDRARIERERAAVELPEGLKAQVEACPLPVLMPSDPGLQRSAVLTRGDGWHALSMNHGGVNVALHALGRGFVRPGLVAELGQDAPLPPDKPRVSQDHLIYSAAFERFGVSYVLELECAKPSEDPHCQREDELLALYRGLVLVGGAR